MTRATVRNLVEAADLAGYGRFPEQIERDWLGRWCHLSIRGFVRASAYSE